MGQIIQVKCTACNLEKELYIGGGLRDCEMETILAALSEEGQRTLMAAVDRGATRISITRIPCTCESCGTIYALPVITCTVNGTGYELRGICPECGAASGREWEENTIPRCPACGAEMRQQQTGHWD